MNKVRIKEFWNDNSENIIGSANFAVIILTSAIVGATISKSRCNAGWKIDYASGTDDLQLIRVHFKNGKTQTLKKNI